jgi:cytochrome P450
VVSDTIRSGEMVDFDPWSPEVLADPYPYYARLRTFAPCARMPAGSADTWVASRYEDVRALLTEYRRFSVSEGLGVRHERTVRNPLTTQDPPGHTAARRTIQPHFLPRRLIGWAQRADAVAAELTDAFVAAGGGEFKGQVAMPLVLRITTEMMGLPDDPELLAAYPRWSRRSMEDLDRRDDDPDLPALRADLAEAKAWFIDFIRARRAEHREAPRDLVDMILETRQSGNTELETISLALTLLAAGNQNTADLIAHAVALLCENPDQWQLLAADPDGHAGATVEEAVRYASPAQAVYRLMLEDVEIAGQAVPKGARVMVLFGSANRDERVFPYPDRFDIERRSTVEHLGFGMGVHKCIGMVIARIEGTATLRALAQRAGRLELDGPYTPYVTSAVRGFEALPVKVTPRATA